MISVSHKVVFGNKSINVRALLVERSSINSTVHEVTQYIKLINSSNAGILVVLQELSA